MVIFIVVVFVGGVFVAVIFVAAVFAAVVIIGIMIITIGQKVSIQNTGNCKNRASDKQTDTQSLRLVDPTEIGRTLLLK